MKLKRHSIGFTDDEYEQVSQMITWYKQTYGLKLSRCAIIKHLLFAVWRDIQTENAI